MLNHIDWDNIQNFSSNLIFAFLLISTILYWINLSLFKNFSFLIKIGKLSAILANLFLFFILASRWIVAGYFPLSNLYESLLFLTWILLTGYLYLDLKIKNKLLGVILLPVTLLINGFSNLTLSADMQKSSPLVPALQSNWLMMHVSMMMLSYATLMIGSLLSILFLVVSKYQDINLEKTDPLVLPLYNIMVEYYDTRIISARTSKIGKLKLLQSLDNWSYRIIGLGFPLLTIGIIAGGVWANEAWGSYWSWDPKETYFCNLFTVSYNKRLVW